MELVYIYKFKLKNKYLPTIFTIVFDNKIRIINMDINFQPWKSTNSENKNNLAFVNRIEVGKEVVIPLL